MSQAYSKTPSEYYSVFGAAGLFFDNGVYFFGKYVEGVVQRAGQDALSPAFARSAEQRAFAEAMGDDMETSNAGYADPFAGGGAMGIDEDGEILASGY